MSELFEMVCEKENLDTTKHQLSLPRTGGRKVTFDSGTAVGSLRIREIAIIRTTLSDSRRGSSELDVLEDLLDLDGEEVTMLQMYLFFFCLLLSLFSFHFNQALSYLSPM